jgi:hypothetical protein
VPSISEQVRILDEVGRILNQLEKVSDTLDDAVRLKKALFNQIF